MRPHTPARGDSGFTLLETLVAMTLFSIGILGLAQVQFAASRSAMSSRHASTAALLASDRLEECLATPSFAGITAANFPDEDYGDVAGGDSRYEQFARNVTVQDSLDVAGRVALKTLTVRVTWETARGERDVELSSCVARY